MKVEVKGINLFYEAYGSGIPLNWARSRRHKW